MSKYKKWYDNLITSSRDKPRQKHQGIYYEEHHILPLSLGGNNCADNLLLLTAKEHFIAHLLLMKFTTGRDKYKMAHALLFMQHSPSSSERFTSNSFAAYREQAIDLIKKNRPDSIPVTIWGIHYASKGEAHRCLGISLYSITKIINDPKYTPPPKVIVVKGIEYPSYAAAERALQLSHHVIKRMAHDSTYFSGKGSIPSKPTTIDNITYPSIYAAAKALNVNKKAIPGLVKRST